MSKKFCYLFTEGNASMRELLGGKGANLAEMTFFANFTLLPKFPVSFPNK